MQISNRTCRVMNPRYPPCISDWFRSC